MTADIDIARFTSAIERLAPLDQACIVDVFGVDVSFASNSSAFIAFLHTAYTAAPHQSAPRRPVIRIAARAGESNSDATQPPFIPRLVNTNLLVIEGPGVHGYADSSSLESGAIVATELLERPSAILPLIDTLTLFLVTAMDRTPLHAAALRSDTAALLLAGPGGIGKSTLTYAARAAGITVMSDDAVYIQRAPTLQVWSLQRRIHLPASSASFFPELAPHNVVTMTNGKLKIPIDPLTTQRQPQADPRGICVLSRGGTQTLEAISADDAVALLASKLDPGFDRFHDAIPDCIRAVADRGAWRLRVSGTPASLVPYLAETLRVIS